MRLTLPANAALLTLILTQRPAHGLSGAHPRTSISQRVQRLSVAQQGSGGATALTANEASTARSIELAQEARPIRVARGGDAHRRRRAPGGAEQHLSHLRCNITKKTDSSSDKFEVCPDDCPFWAQDRTDDDFCTFACVAEKDCRKMYWRTPIGDKERSVCRSCIVDGCQSCDFESGEDRCSQCQAGYYLDEEDGQCYFKFGGPWVTWMTCFIIAFVFLVLLWVIDMSVRPSSNDVGLQHGLRFRESAKLRQKKDEFGERKLWPLNTNLISTMVAGPGTMLHFNFQLCVIVWAVYVALVWGCFCQFGDKALWILGTRRFGTPRMNCILVQWGYETQTRLLWAKISFLWIIYGSTFFLSLAFAVYQLRKFQEIDFVTKTFKDYVLMVVGLPSIEGTKRVEEELAAKVASLAGQKVVGVSVAWDFVDQEKAIWGALDQDLRDAEAAEEHQSPRNAKDRPNLGPARAILYSLEQSAFGLSNTPEEIPAVEEAPEIVAVLESMTTTAVAFVVFDTQGGRDITFQKVKAARGFSFEGKDGIKLQCVDAEPDTVMWGNFGHQPAHQIAMKVVAGFGIINLACLFWAVVFYAPYAYYVMTFNYENGRQPGIIVGFSFSMIVVIGNAIMYEVCARISDWMGFHFRDTREAFYMILYTVACMFNVMLDFVTTYRTSELVMEGLGFRTYFGVPLKDVDIFTAKFETYGMQRALAENTYNYAFPSTFLIPFLLEPWVTIVLPLMLGILVVKNHPEVQGKDAEDWLASVPMDMGRYADLLLNTILGILIFYFPGGYTWILFLGMAGSHIYIYIFDHFKVLRVIPSCCYASFDVDWCAQAMMAPITGIILACVVWRSNCTKGHHCINPWTDGQYLILACVFAWVCHVVVHLLVLTYVVPLFGRSPPAEDDHITYKDLSAGLPCSWFSSNPVNCLRSKYKYKHNPPCAYYVLGKERFMEANPSIGCFYDGSQHKRV